MARYKQYNYDQLKLLPISFSRQILPGTFESISRIIVNNLNLTAFDATPSFPKTSVCSAFFNLPGIV